MDLKKVSVSMALVCLLGGTTVSAAASTSAAETSPMGVQVADASEYRTTPPLVPFFPEGAGNVNFPQVLGNYKKNAWDRIGGLQESVILRLPMKYRPYAFTVTGENETLLIGEWYRHMKFGSEDASESKITSDMLRDWSAAKFLQRAEEGNPHRERAMLAISAYPNLVEIMGGYDPVLGKSSRKELEDVQEYIHVSLINAFLRKVFLGTGTGDAIDAADHFSKMSIDQIREEARRDEAVSKGLGSDMLDEAYKIDTKRAAEAIVMPLPFMIRLVPPVPAKN